MDLKNIATINFIDKTENQNVCVIVRSWDGHVSLCLSLELGGDIETLIPLEDVRKLILTLQEAVESIKEGD